MGIFDFIKRDKADSTQMDLPPMPKMEGLDAPMPDQDVVTQPVEMSSFNEPMDYTQSMLQNQEMPEQNIPVNPSMDQQQMADMAPIQEVQNEPVQAPPVTDNSMYQSQTEPVEFPHVDDVIPDKIPPLEGIPEPPSFSEDVEIPKNMQTFSAQNMDISEPPEMDPMFEQPSYIPEYESPKPRRFEGPLFVKAENLKDAVSYIDYIKNMFKEEESTFNHITETKSLQDKKYEKFRETIEDIQRKMLFIDKQLFENR